MLLWVIYLGEAKRERYIDMSLWVTRREHRYIDGEQEEARDTLLWVNKER